MERKGKFRRILDVVTEPEFFLTGALLLQGAAYVGVDTYQYRRGIGEGVNRPAIGQVEVSSEQSLEIKCQGTGRTAQLEIQEANGVITGATVYCRPSAGIVK